MSAVDVLALAAAVALATATGVVAWRADVRR